MIPLWVVLSDFFSGQGDLIHQLFSSGASTHTKLGNLYGPLSIFQLVGIWPVGDFRLTAPTIPSVLWIGLTLLAAARGRCSSASAGGGTGSPSTWRSRSWAVPRCTCPGAPRG